MAEKPSEPKGLKKFWRILGPGLITGASDDDPSGIATYSQAGAGFGYSTLWTALLTFPLMASIQGMCARVGIVTQEGLTGTLKKNYPRWILYSVMLLSFPAIILNIGADIQAMGAVSTLIFPNIPDYIFSIIFTGILLYFIIKFPYTKMASVLKWLCLILFLYFIVPFLVKVDWTDVAKHTFIPTIRLDKDFFEILVAILGTTISPYLFFWQATMEAEDMVHKKKVVVNKKMMDDMKLDVNFGMLFSNVVMFFTILTTGAVLFKAGIHKIDTVEQAAKALEPLAGHLAYLLFAVGIIGTGFLAIPVLAGSLSYIVAETFGWKASLDKKFHQARPFYIIIIISLILGLTLNYIGITPMQALIYSAILYGLTAPVLIAMVIHICNNKAVMGKYTNGKLSNVLGFLTLIIMTVSAIGLIYMQLN